MIEVLVNLWFLCNFRSKEWSNRDKRQWCANVKIFFSTGQSPWGFHLTRGLRKAVRRETRKVKACDVTSTFELQGHVKTHLRAREKYAIDAIAILLRRRTDNKVHVFPETGRFANGGRESESRNSFVTTIGKRHNSRTNWLFFGRNSRDSS